MDDCAGDFAELVLPDGYTPSRAYSLILELGAPLGLPIPQDTVLLRVHVEQLKEARSSAEVADLLVMSLLSYALETVHLDPRRVFLFAGSRPPSDREEPVLAWYIALHNPDRFAGVLAGIGAWKEGMPLACNAANFTGLGILARKGDRAADAFLAELRKFNPGHVRLEWTGDRDQDLLALGPEIAKWWEGCVRPPGPPRIRLVDDQGTPLRAYWLRLAPHVPSTKAEDVGHTWKQNVLAKDAVLEAEIKEKDLVVVHAERVAAFDLLVDPRLFAPGSVVRVAINGQVPEARVVRTDIDTLLDDYKERRDPDLLVWGRITFTAR
jgi:poly(3-hydroxybutyrate) depolymerase